MSQALFVAAAAGAVAWWALGGASAQRPADPPGTPLAERITAERAGRVGEWLDGLLGLGRRIPGAPPPELGRLLEEAGRPLGLDAAGWAALERGWAAAGGLVVVGLLVVGRGLPPEGRLLPLVGLGALVGPRHWLDRRGRDRASTLDRRLPDLADRIALGLEGGLGILDAIQEAVRAERTAPGTPPWLHRELAWLTRDLWLSDSTLPDALGRMERRIAAPRLRALRAQLTLAARTGGPVAGTLRAFSRSAREEAAAGRAARLGELSFRLAWVGIVPVLAFLGVAMTYVQGMLGEGTWTAR